MTAKSPGLGPRSMERLAAVGVHSLEDIRRLGAVEVFRRVRARFPAWTSLNLLWGLYAAQHGISWLSIPPGKREQLKAEAGITPPSPGAPRRRGRG